MAAPLMAADTVALENRFLRATFDAARGGAMVSLVDKQTGREFVNPRALTGLYELTFRDAAHNRIRLTERDAGKAVLTGSAAAVKIVAARHAGRAIATQCECALPPGAASLSCRIKVKNRTALELYSIRFPAVEFRAPLGEHDWLLVPRCDGQIVTPPTAARVTYPGSASMQFLAYGDAIAGIAAATLDSEGYRKDLGVSRRAGALGLNLVHYPAITSARDFALPYPVRLSIFHGDWQTAASDYKAWAVRQPWCRKRLAERLKELPEWLLRAPFFYTMSARGQMPDGKTALRYQAIGEQAEAYAKLLRGPVCAMIMAWEKHGAWNTPDYFPPVGGADAFRALTARLRAAGNQSLVFLSGLKWTLATRLNRPLEDSPYDGSAAFVGEPERNAIVAEDGKTDITGDPAKSTGRYAHLCPATRYTQDLLARIVRQSIDLGVTAVQLDQVVGGGTPACYSTRHGHPPGGGNWSAQALYRLFARLRQEGKRRSRDFAFLIEEPGEMFIPVLDAYHARDYSEGRWPRDGRGVRGVPLFTYVYHDYLLGYGGDSAGISDRPSAQNIYSAAANLINGKIPAAAVWTRYLDPARVERAQLELLAESGALFRGPARDFLLFGERLPTPARAGPEVTVPVWIQAANKSEPYRFPSVLESAWRLPDGRTGRVLVNIGTSPVEVGWPARPGRLRLAPHRPVFVQ